MSNALVVAPDLSGSYPVVLWSLPSMMHAKAIDIIVIVVIIIITVFMYLFFSICRNSVRLAIRKVMYAPAKAGEQPSVEVSKEFMMSPSKLHLEVSLDKELYYHGETLSVNVHIQNNSNKPVKKIKVSVRQFADICLFSTAQYKCTVAEIESE